MNNAPFIPPPSRSVCGGVSRSVRRFRLRCVAGALMLGLALVPATAANPVRKVRVSDATLAKQLEQKGARLLADYGGFQLLEVPAATAAGLATNATVEFQDGTDVIELHARRLNTAGAEAQSLRRTVGDFTGRRLHLVHFVGPIQPAWRADLERHGARVVTYLPQNAYLVYGDAAALRRLQSAARRARHIQWEGPYADEFKLLPTARAAAQPARARRAADELFALQLVADPEANDATFKLIDGLKRAPVVKTARVLDYVNVIVRLAPDRLEELAARPDVVSIARYVMPKKRDERQDIILSGNLAGSQPGGPGYLAWLASKGFNQAQFTASGFVVDVSDSGIDNGTQAPGHFGLYVGGNTSLASRVVYNRLVGTPHAGSTLAGCDGHGTLNAHIIAGFNDQTGFPFTDAAGYSFGLGVAPWVKVGSSVVFDPDSFTSPNYTDLQSRAYADGARISANSWGASTAGDYDTDCQEYDALVRDAQPAGAPISAPGNQQMVIVFAAGNDGPDARSVGSPGTAKNIICVGASENVHSHSTTNGGNNGAGNDGCDTPDTEADSANDIASFSSRGPCSDSRVKPDLVAPGTHVTGGVAQQTPASPTGTALACFRGDGVCALPGSGTIGDPDNFFPMGQQFYTTSSGTSHSTPAVAGGAALLRQWFLNQGLPAPSPALTKAWLVNAARYLDGAGAHDSLPSNNQGMGCMNLGMAFDGVPRLHRDQVPADKFTATGQTRTFAGAILDTNQPFRVTVAWTDAPGSTVGNAYNNDLDLTVVAGGQTYRGNVFNGPHSTPGGAADPRNNLESVFLPAGVGGSFVVTITAANINSDGVPNDGDPLDQDFALVIYNAAPQNAPVILPENVLLIAENCPPGNGVLDPGETVTVSLALQNVGPAPTTNLVATLLADGGVLDPGSPQTYGALTNGSPPVARSFTFTAVANCGDTVTATWQLQDGASDLGTVSQNFRLGLNTMAFTENFDSLTPPALPTGWTVTHSGAGTPWATAAAMSDSPPNAAFCPDPPSNSANDLTTPLFTLESAGAQLSFRHWYSTESCCDGGTLQLALAGGPFQDLLEAGGSFSQGGYAPGGWWAGSSGGFITTVVNFPPSAAGQPMQLRWHFESDGSVSSAGWYVDSITLSGRFECCRQNDVALTITDSPDPAAPGAAITNVIEVHNSGPLTAPDLFVTNVLSPGATFVSAASSQGTWTYTNGEVICHLGTLGPAAAATVTVVSVPAGTGFITNTASVTVPGFDAYAANNTAQSVTHLVPPQLFINDPSMAEGDGGLTTILFTVSLWPASPQTVTVDYATVNLTALAGEDYLATNGTLTFAPFETNQTLVVPVLGDTLSEADEQFIVSLSNPVNATLGRPEGRGTLLDDDPLPLLSIDDVTVVEGDTGLTAATFTVRLAPASGREVAVDFSTTDDLATGPSDFVPTNGTLFFNPGQLSTTLTVLVHGDTLNEQDETFFVNLSNPVGALLDRTPGLGEILNDDPYPTILAAQVTLISESCLPANGGVDPGETVTLNLTLTNAGSGGAQTTNLVVTLRPGGGVTAPSGPQDYGALVGGGPAATRSFTFTSQGECGSNVTALFQLQDGPTELNTLSVALPTSGRRAVLDENFDSLTPPNLPVGWPVFHTGAGSGWVTSPARSDTPPRAAFVSDPGSESESRLTTPPQLIQSTNAQLSFRHWFSTESCCDGGWLELAVAGGPFEEITAAGGRFLEGAYTDLAWWAGNSGDFITTVVELPPQAAGQIVELRWRFTSDSSVEGEGWYVDSIQLIDGAECCVPNDVFVTVADAPDPVFVGSNLTYTVTVGNSGPSPASGVFVTNFLPAGADFVSATPATGTVVRDGSTLRWEVGALAGSTTATLLIVVQPSAAGTLVHSAVVVRNESDPAQGNNQAVETTQAVVPAVDLVFSQPAPISIPDSGPGSPYPSTLLVAGVTGAITNVSVTLSNLNHSYPDDLDVLLVGPGGQTVVLMSDAGGSADLTDVTLTFDDGAPAPLPDSTQITAGRWQPVNHNTGDLWPGPAPAGPYGTSLNVFTGTDPNGTWSLFVYDDAGADQGALAGGWSLRFEILSEPAPRFLPVELNAGQLTLRFATQPGRTYVVEYTDSLTDVLWQPLDTRPGDGTVQSVVVDTTAPNQRFYRLRLP